MTENLCRSGTRFDDAASSVCRGSAITRVCLGGTVYYEVAAAPSFAFTTAQIASITDNGFYNHDLGWPGAGANAVASIAVGIGPSGQFAIFNASRPLDEITTTGAEPVQYGPSHDATVSNFAFGHQVETRVSDASQVSEIRLTQLSGDAANAVTAGYTMGTWQDWSGSGQIDAGYSSPASSASGPDPGWQRSGVFRVELKSTSGQIISFDVAISARNFNGTYP